MRRVDVIRVFDRARAVARVVADLHHVASAVVHSREVAAGASSADVLPCLAVRPDDAEQRSGAAPSEGQSTKRLKGAAAVFSLGSDRLDMTAREHIDELCLTVCGEDLSLRESGDAIRIRRAILIRRAVGIAEQERRARPCSRTREHSKLTRLRLIGVGASHVPVPVGATVGFDALHSIEPARRRGEHTVIDQPRRSAGIIGECPRT